MSLHHEISFETEICESLHAREWLYAAGDAAQYDRALALYPPDVLAWVRPSKTDRGMGDTECFNPRAPHFGGDAAELLADAGAPSGPDAERGAARQRARRQRAHQ